MSQRIYRNDDIPLCPHCNLPISDPQDLADTWVTDDIDLWHNDKCWECSMPFSARRVSENEIEFIDL